MSKYAQSCNQVPRETVVGRVRAFRKHVGRTASEAGVCQICGHATRFSYRVTKPDENGKIQHCDIERGSPEEQRMLELKQAGLIPEGMMIFAVHVCEAAEPEAVWKEAGRPPGEPTKQAAKVEEPEEAQLF